MRLENIRIAVNGFVLEDQFGRTHIAKTLLEAAQIAGEIVPSYLGCYYAPGMTPGDLSVAKACFREGKKSEAIKILCNCFVPRLGLREAKDLIEILCD